MTAETKRSEPPSGVARGSSTSRGWTALRLAFVLLALVQGARNPGAWIPARGVTLGLLIALAAYGLLAVPLAVGLQRLNPRAPAAWRYPSWSMNPLTMREPLQFFHAAGFVFIGIGAGIALRQLHDLHAIALTCLPMIAVGAGLLGGVYASTVLYRQKMQPRSS